MSKAFQGKHEIHVTLKKLKDKYNLKWLRISMPYRNFANVLEILAEYTEIYGSYRNKNRFYMLSNCLSNADDGQCPKQSVQVLPPLSPESH